MLHRDVTQSFPSENANRPCIKHPIPNNWLSTLLGHSAQREMTGFNRNNIVESATTSGSSSTVHIGP